MRKEKHLQIKINILLIMGVFIILGVLTIINKIEVLKSSNDLNRNILNQIEQKSK